LRRTVLLCLCRPLLVALLHALSSARRSGNRYGWRFVNAWWFRLAHLAAIGIVVAQAWFGIACPLTTLESWLRVRAGEAAYETSFIEHWLTRLLYYDAPAWVFTVAYTLFGLAVVAAWWRFPPGRDARQG
jgi:hypothetical protein